MRALHSLLANDRGLASLEFAIVLPIMLSLLFATYELSQLVRAQLKVDTAAQSIADMVAQQAAGVTSGTSGSLGNFCAAGKLMMTPFAAGTGSSTFAVSIASVTNYSSGGVTLDWESDASCSTTATALGATAKTLATSPTNLIPTAGTPGDSVIVATVTYAYNSPLQYFLPGLLSLTHTAFARPRSNNVVACGSPCT
ncbi:TadE/TadG family type IV pilus assembly protein [Paraburkholderia oxyphila]|uniref:TadE/TadG family type IV pilus assembly protein n=1 Tax=Paraburkholderia oxyphila TaxID=614212 RepID=UPI000488BDAA|nr:TadE/TadG family type IV pilus assembly protein [Paraburkholderia oxyphila]